ncbi:MAG: hypothetical protein ABIZ30_00100, partial [Candidatus Limnocylindrales bacterium]
MDEPSVAEAVLIEDGLVTSVWTRTEMLALAGDQVPVIDIGDRVAYPGFIDAHALWIGDPEYYKLESAAEAILDAARRRGARNERVPGGAGCARPPVMARARRSKTFTPSRTM